MKSFQFPPEKEAVFSFQALKKKKKTIPMTVPHKFVWGNCYARCSKDVCLASVELGIADGHQDVVHAVFGQPGIGHS